MSRDRILPILGGVVVAVFGLLALLTLLGAPIDFFLKLVLLVVLVGLAFLFFRMRLRPGITGALLVVLSVALILLININGIVTAANDVVTVIFNPDLISPESVVVCRESSACSTVHAIIYTAVFLLLILTGFAYTTLLERKYIAYFQNRVGPNRVGPGGFLQPLADAVKLIFKEDVMPAGASKIVWFFAPMLKALPVLVLIGVVPLGPDIIVPWFDGLWYEVPLGLIDPNVGVLWLLALTTVATYGVVLAGWASNNKYAMLGGLRASAQMISYELALGLAMIVPIMLAGSMSIGDIIEAQGNVPILGWFVFQNPLAAGILLIALIAEVNRAPFDLPEAEQELTAGYMTEYSGMKFAMFMMAEYLGMISVSVIAASLFFGGYHFLMVDRLPILGPLVMIAKVVILLLGLVWIRATLPRIRYDRLMMFGWKVMLPLSLIAVAWTAVSVIIGDVLSPQAYILISGAMFVLVVGGAWWLLSRSSGPAVEDALVDDPLITGEPHGVGYMILRIVGAFLAGLFVLVDALAWVFDLGRKMGEVPEQPEATEATQPK